MATVDYWQLIWYATNTSDALRPGDPQDWVFWGYNIGDAISLSAHPCCTLSPTPEVDLRYQMLAIENVHLEMNLIPAGGGQLDEERRLFFTVRNVGQAPVGGYVIGFGPIH